MWQNNRGGSIFNLRLMGRGGSQSCRTVVLVNWFMRLGWKNVQAFVIPYWTAGYCLDKQPNTNSIFKLSRDEFVPSLYRVKYVSKGSYREFTIIPYWTAGHWPKKYSHHILTSNYHYINFYIGLFSTYATRRPVRRSEGTVRPRRL